VFFCSLCNKQYKLAHEFESHLSSYDHNHRKVIHFACSFDFPNASYWIFFSVYVYLHHSEYLYCAEV
jgi:hypothetical protein